MTELLDVRDVATFEARHGASTYKLVKAQYTFPFNDPSFDGGKYFGKDFMFKTGFEVYTNDSKRIMINVPGAGGKELGHEYKYAKIAKKVSATGLAAVILTGNSTLTGYLCDIHLRAALQYARDWALSTCDDAAPEVCLMGMSAGASAIASIAWEYPEVSRILLVSPAGDMGEQRIKFGLKRFHGDVTIVHGKNDEIVGPDAGKEFLKAATGASSKKLFEIDQCDHQFTGEFNGRILSQAPFYAFASTDFDRPVFPDPRGGFKLYD